MRKLLLILCCGILVTGCGKTLRNSWLNFRAYYNTYYNAQENFRTGLKKVEEQPVTIDPNEPVRIHQSPVQAGNNDFQKAIDKGARILRKFPDSEWADDALLLIGKSYYYRQEFFPAFKKFEELRNASQTPEMEQLSIIWKGWTLLDLKEHTEGITFLESELSQYPNNWSAQRKAEIQALAGEHYAMLENWEQASNLLSKAVTGLKTKQLLGRTLFLYGQTLERMERYGEAYFTYSRVSENFPGFEYIFWARYKQADVARKEGNLDEAIAIYKGLQKDDKNYQRRNELTFEIARTLEMQGQVAEAEKSYKQLLYGVQVQQRRSLKADIYYRLGRIYSDQYHKYPVAAAYFDSSSSVSDAPQKIEETIDAQTLADVFGTYTRLRNTMNRADSLIWLGSLSETALDSALEKIRVQKRRALQKEQESRAQTSFANRTTSDNDGQNVSSNQYGFLNHRNPRLVSQSKAEFRIIWGDRPLIDNWRRLEVVRRSGISSRSQQQNQRQGFGGQEGTGLAVEMNLEAIPRTLEEKNELRVEKVNAQYELGNLLFLNLNRADSARYYFHQVIDSNVEPKLRPRAMYSLHELFKSEEMPDSLQYWEDRILEEYPRSRYARRIRGMPDDVSVDSIAIDSTKKLIREFQYILNDPTEKNKATKLRKLALENRSSELAPYIYYQSIEYYIQEAKDDTVQADSLGSATKSIPVNSQLTDSTQVISAAMGNNLTFSGARWDSVRLVVDEFDTTFPVAAQREKVKKLKEILDQPEPTKQLPTCERLGITLAVSPSMNEFLSIVEYPKDLEGTSISGEVEYSFVVSESGEIQSYELISQPTKLGIEEAFEKAFEKSLEFKPLTIQKPPEKIKCAVLFPIQH